MQIQNKNWNRAVHYPPRDPNPISTPLPFPPLLSHLIWVLNQINSMQHAFPLSLITSFFIFDYFVLGTMTDCWLKFSKNLSMHTSHTNGVSLVSLSKFYQTKTLSNSGMIHSSKLEYDPNQEFASGSQGVLYLAKWNSIVVVFKKLRARQLQTKRNFFVSWKFGGT